MKLNMLNIVRLSCFCILSFFSGLVAVDENIHKEIVYNETLLVQNYDQLNVHAALAALYAKVNDLDRARNHLNYISQKGMPESVELAFECSNLWLTVGDPHQTIMILEHLLMKYPNNPSIMHNLAYAHKLVGNVSKAIEILESIVRLYPDRDDAQFALGHAYLAAGDFKRAWPQHDKFLRRTDRYTLALKDWLLANSIAGKRIVIRQEGGLGDMIQWISCAKDLHAMGATVLVCAPSSLVPLLSLCPYLDRVINVNDKPVKIPPFDAQITVMSLPCVLELTESRMAQYVPFLKADTELVQFWKDRLGKGFNVGLCWQADVHNDISRLAIARRGISLATLARLSSLDGINFYSLQKKDGLEQLNDSIPMVVHTFGQDFDESHGAFMDTAAVMCSLDLIITVDTAVAHLAGALGRPVWLLLPYQTDWRWIIGREDSPWYPSMKIFKQSKPFDWEEVIEKVLYALQDLIEK